jgi:hypothetical protein
MEEAIEMAENEGMKVILLGDLNIDLKLGSYDRYKENADRLHETAHLLNKSKLHNLGIHYKQRMGIGDWTWHMDKTGTHYFSRTDYILTRDITDFTFLKIKQPRFDSDHRMVLAGLNVDNKYREKIYITRRARLDIKIKDATRVDTILEELKDEVPKRNRKVEDRKQSWISLETWKLIDQKVSARRHRKTNLCKVLRKKIRKSLKKDREERCEKAAKEIEEYLTKGKSKEAYAKLRFWYKPKEKPSKPTLQDERRTREEYDLLYRSSTPDKENIVVQRMKDDINDDIPSEEEIKKAVMRMRLGKTPGATGIKVEDLRKWMEQAENDNNRENWEKMVEVVQLAFTEMKLPKRFGMGILVLIPKGEPNQYRGIALLEVIYKVISNIINNRISNKIKYHDAIHGFRRGRGTTTAISELKLLMRTTMKNKKSYARYLVFLDLKKAYDTLDRKRTLEILEAYGVGPNIRRFIEETWNMDEMIPKQAGFYGKSFKASRGVRQGDIMSPTIFNVICDAVINYCEQKFVELYPNCKIPKSMFYADDGVITGSNVEDVQNLLDIYTDAFERVGLKMNVAKTKAMIMEGRKNITCIRGGKDEPSYAERMNEMIICSRCDLTIKRSSIKKHEASRKCIQTGQKKRKELQRDENVCLPCTPSTYNISVKEGNATKCPIDKCKYETCKPASMRQHFRNTHIEDIIIIEEEGLLSRCEKCGIFQKNVGEKHQQSKQCRSNTEDRLIKLRQKENERLAKETVFTVNNVAVENVKEFKYLGRIVTHEDDDMKAVDHNIKRASVAWARLQKLLCKGKMKNPRSATSIYKTVIQAVLLYGSETWKMSQAIIIKLNNFHRRCARHIAGQHIRPIDDGKWEYPRTEEILERTGLEQIEKYITQRRIQVMEYLNPNSKAMLNLTNDNEIEIKMEEVIWWKPMTPILNLT